VVEFERVRQLVAKLDVPPALVRVSYSLPADRRDQVLTTIGQILAPGAPDERLADSAARLSVTGDVASVKATAGQHQRVREALAEFAQSQSAEAVSVKAYRIQNRDASELQAILTRLL